MPRTTLPPGWQRGGSSLPGHLLEHVHDCVNRNRVHRFLLNAMIKLTVRAVAARAGGTVEADNLCVERSGKVKRTRVSANDEFRASQQRGELAEVGGRGEAAADGFRERALVRSPRDERIRALRHLAPAINGPELVGLAGSGEDEDVFGFRTRARIFAPVERRPPSGAGFSRQSAAEGGRRSTSELHVLLNHLLRPIHRNTTIRKQQRRLLPNRFAVKPDALFRSREYA